LAALRDDDQRNRFAAGAWSAMRAAQQSGAARARGRTAGGVLLAPQWVPGDSVSPTRTRSVFQAGESGSRGGAIGSRPSSRVAATAPVTAPAPRTWQLVVSAALPTAASGIPQRSAVMHGSR
jgi:hypothetical protein